MVKAAQALKDMIDTWTDVDAKFKTIADLEHAGDNITTVMSGFTAPSLLVR